MLYTKLYIIKNSAFQPVIATIPQIAIPKITLVSIILASYRLCCSFSVTFGNLITVKNKINGGIMAYIPYNVIVR